MFPSWPHIGIALAVLALVFGVQQVRISNVRAELAACGEQRAKERALAIDTAASAVQSAIAEERKIANAISEVLKDERKKTEALADDVRAGAAVADGLRQRARALAAACGGRGPADPPPTPGSTPAADAGQMLADMLVRLEADGRELAEYADRARIAGQTCERSYDALKPE